MPAIRPRPARFRRMLTVLATLSLAAPASSAADLDPDVGATSRQAVPGGPWAITRRTVGEGRCAFRYWQVDYWLRNDGPSPATLRPEQVSAQIEGWVSNSRVPGHAFPKHSKIAVSGTTGLSATCDVIPSSDETRRCRERAVLQIWPADRAENPPDPIAKATVRLVSLTEQPSYTIAPGKTLRVRLRLEHDHFLYGPYDALLGPRSIELNLAANRLRDNVPLDRDSKLPRGEASAWPAPGDPPADRMDSRVFVSPPESLHLEAHIPGNQSYRFKECPVKYGTRMRLRYWYLIAPGTEGEGKSRIVQYKDAPTAWKILSDGDVDQALTTVGRWVKVERFFRTEPEATSLTLEFRVSGEVGEIWIDDVSLEAVDDDPAGP